MAKPAVRVHVEIVQFTNLDLSDDACTRLDRLLSDCASILTAEYPPMTPGDAACDAAWLQGLMRIKSAFAVMSTDHADPADIAAARETYLHAAACMLYAVELLDAHPVSASMGRAA